MSQTPNQPNIEIDAALEQTTISNTQSLNQTVPESIESFRDYLAWLEVLSERDPQMVYATYVQKVYKRLLEDIPVDKDEDWIWEHLRFLDPVAYVQKGEVRAVHPQRITCPLFIRLQEEDLWPREVRDLYEGKKRFIPDDNQNIRLQTNVIDIIQALEYVGLSLHFRKKLNMVLDNDDEPTYLETRAAIVDAIPLLKNGEKLLIRFSSPSGAYITMRHEVGMGDQLWRDEEGKLRIDGYDGNDEGNIARFETFLSITNDGIPFREGRLHSIDSDMQRFQESFGYAFDEGRVSTALPLGMRELNRKLVPELLKLDVPMLMSTKWRMFDLLHKVQEK